MPNPAGAQSIVTGTVFWAKMLNIVGGAAAFFRRLGTGGTHFGSFPISRKSSESSGRMLIRQPIHHSECAFDCVIRHSVSRSAQSTVIIADHTGIAVVYFTCASAKCEDPVATEGCRRTVRIRKRL